MLGTKRSRGRYELRSCPAPEADRVPCSTAGGESVWPVRCGFGRVLKPIWETQLNHRTIGRLDHSVVTGNGTLLTVADLVPDPQTTEDLVLASECEEQRLRQVVPAQ